MKGLSARLRQVMGLGLRVQHLRFRVYGLRVKSLGSRSRG